MSRSAAGRRHARSSNSSTRWIPISRTSGGGWDWRRPRVRPEEADTLNGPQAQWALGSLTCKSNHTSHFFRMPSSLSSPRARFGVAFSLLARRWRRTLDAQLAKAGLSDATWVPLIHLQEAGDGITQKALAERVGVDASSLVRVLDILSRQGLIERRAAEHDGRARLVHLTAAGRKRVDEIRGELWKIEEDLLA